MTLWEVAIDSHTQREPAVLIVGRMWAEERGKGHDQLIAAWPAVRAAIPDAVLWIVGDGDDRKRIMARARMLGVDDSVRFFGRLSDAELGSLYRRASLFAMPSRQEGFGLVYLEAMLNGLPCLGSTADAAGQVIVDGKTGILVPYGDVDSIATGVKSILSKPEAAARMGENGRRHVLENFTYSQFRTSLLSALELPGLP
jgi:phosphatidylinositol alpha-1,6-mannosyltransferase